MKSIDRRFTELIEGNKQFVIPVFQRDYSWKAKEHCARLWRDVIRAGRSLTPDQHFLGAIVCIPAADHAMSFPRSLVIDGQQRLTTLMLLLTAVRDFVRQDAVVQKAGGLSVEQINDYYLINRHEEGDARYRLLLRSHDQRALSLLIDAKADSGRPVSKAIEDAYESFRGRLTANNIATVMNGVRALVIVDITLTRGVDDSQAIFESLNAKALALNKSDLIRNCVLMDREEPEQSAMYTQYWSEIENLFRGRDRVFDNFARDYLDMKRRRPTQTRTDDIYPEFRSYWKDRLKQMDLEPALSDMVRFARYYAAVRIGPDPGKAREERYQRIRRLRAAPAITVMRLLDRRENEGDLDERDFLEALDLIESYLVRRSVCGLSTRGYDTVFASLTARIGGKVAGILDELKVGFKLLPAAFQFPSNEEFLAALREGELYRRQVCRLLLDRLENHGSKEPSDTSGYTIEHILPQSARLGQAWVEMLGPEWRQIQATYMHRLGNLTLTGYNAEYSDRSFEDKKKHEHGFSVSALRLNRTVNAKEEWTEKEIAERTEALAQKALSIWRGLRVAESVVDRARFRDRERKIVGRRVESIKIDPSVAEALGRLRQLVEEMGQDVAELVEVRSVSFHRDCRYFLELVPRKKGLVALLRLDAETAKATATTDWKWVEGRVPGSQYRVASETGLLVPTNADDSRIEDVVRLIRQAYAAVG